MLDGVGHKLADQQQCIVNLMALGHAQQVADEGAGDPDRYRPTGENGAAQEVR